MYKLIIISEVLHGSATYLKLRKETKFIMYGEVLRGKME
jgi:hypothetical protein